MQPTHQRRNGVVLAEVTSAHSIRANYPPHTHSTLVVKGGIWRAEREVVAVSPRGLQISHSIDAKTRCPETPIQRGGAAVCCRIKTFGDGGHRKHQLAHTHTHTNVILRWREEEKNKPKGNGACLANWGKASKQAMASCRRHKAERCCCNQFLC